jgi:carbon-monoxide dehydrogenase large subunit
MIGTSLPRVEDADLLTGRARFVADLPRPPGCVDLRFVRSHEAHAVVRGVDLGTARGMPGVVAAVAAADLPGLPSMPFVPGAAAPHAMDRPPLAVDRVRFVAEAVAVVAADEASRAHDAAELVMLDLEPLEPVIGLDQASRAGAPTLFDTPSNVVEEAVIGDETVPALARSAVRFELTVPIGRVIPASIEPRGIVVAPGPGGRLTVWCSHQAPHRLRDHLAGAFGLDPALVRVVAPSVGGAFGGKSATFPEYLVAVRLANELDRPVRWIETREEAFTAATHGRGQRHRLDVGASEAGRIEGLDALVELDVGAYPHTGSLLAFNTAWMMSGPYRIGELRVRTRTVVTNATPTAPYRGAGRPEAALSLERVMDEIARRVGLDPVEVRLRNFVDPDAFPYETPTGARYDSGRYAVALEEACRLADYHGLREEQRRLREHGAGSAARRSLLGVGIGSYVERSGGQPGSWEDGAVEVRGDGSIVATSGSSSQGQGHRTAFAQIVAAALDVEPARVRVVQGDTDLVPTGTGTFASRSIQIGGSALHVAAHEVLDRARSAAAERLEVDESDLEYSRGVFATVGAPSRRVGLEELAADGIELSASHRFSSPQAFPSGTHVAAVEIDVETGSVQVRTLVAVDDCGSVVNPQIVEGQAMGSIAQGIAQALFEGAPFDEHGQPAAVSFLTYAIPSAADLTAPTVSTIETPNPNVPLGAKGAGESGCIGTPPAIVNAVIDALDDPETASIELPITPERIWRLTRRHRT